MSLFIAYRSNVSPDEIAAGLERVREHYNLPSGVSEDGFHAKGLGAWMAWGHYDNQKQYRHASDDRQTAFLTHIPLGYSRVLASRPGDPKFALDVGRRLRDDPAAISDFAAPFVSLLTDRRSYIRVAIDGVGLGRCFHYKTARGTFISNRAVAAILLSGEVPGACETGWASQLMFGYFWDDLSPFEGVKTFKAGEHVNLTLNGVDFGKADAMTKWMAGDAEPLFDGFDRSIGEMQQAIDFDQVTVNLSGGRDSRATAAMLTAHLGDRALLKTNYPPLVERDAAAPLVAKLPYFDRYKGENDAYSKDRRIWQARARVPASATGSLMDRARTHVRSFEGMALASHMAGASSPYPAIGSGTLTVGLGGGGGEISKAYGWAKASRPAAILKAAKEIKLTDRLKEFVLTSDRSLGMLTGNRYASDFWPMLSRYRTEASLVGLNHYRFLNYHYLMTRVGRAAALGVTDVHVPLFMGPHHLSAAMRQSPQAMAAANMHRKITEHYRPEWTGMPYEGDMHADQARRIGTAPGALIWQGAQANEFRDILATRAWYGEPYDFDAIQSCYDNLEGGHGVLQQRGYDLVYRAAFMEFLDDLRAKTPKHVPSTDRKRFPAPWLFPVSFWRGSAARV